MKKTYISPVAQTVVVVTGRMIASSIKVDGDKAEVVIDDEEYDEPFNSRKHGNGRNVWDEEEEEENYNGW
ncbi:MAG: hypothetical protein IKZ48_08170 [Prevotella sp.]|nr:hypothetical protein [Prevotella sp.]